MEKVSRVMYVSLIFELIMALAVLPLPASASSEVADEAMIREARAFFHETIGYSYDFIDQYFTTEVQWWNDQQTWRVIFTFQDMYDNRFATACLGHVYGDPTGNLISPPQYIVVFDEENHLLSQPDDLGFPVYLNRYMSEANHWYRIEQIKEQKGYNDTYGRIWQFWPYDIKLEFAQSYGSPSGFWKEVELITPTEDMMSYDNALVLLQDFISEKNLDIDTQNYYIDASLITLSCAETNENDPSWLIRLYEAENELYRQCYMINICAKHKRVNWIDKTSSTYIDSDSSAHYYFDDQPPISVYNRWDETPKQ